MHQYGNDMKKYQIISMSSRSMTPAQIEEHHRELIKLANDPQVPWWQNNPTVPSTRYVLDTFAAKEVGVPDPYGKEKKRCPVDTCLDCTVFRIKWSYEGS